MKDRNTQAMSWNKVTLKGPSHVQQKPASTWWNRPAKDIGTCDARDLRVLTEMVVIEYSDLRTRATCEMTRTRVWASNRPTRATTGNTHQSRPPGLSGVRRTASKCCPHQSPSSDAVITLHVPSPN